MITRAERSRSSSWAIRCSSIACSFFASSYSAFSVMSPNSRATRIRSATSRRFSVCRMIDLLPELLVALGGEYDFLQSDLLNTSNAPPRARERAAIVARRVQGSRKAAAATICRSMQGNRSARALVPRPGRDPGPARARADGGRERSGLPAPGPPIRRGARLLRDGLGGGDPAPQRAHARLPARRLGRASARDPDLRLRSRRDGRGGADGRGRGRRHRRHQLRLPRAQGDEDRRGRIAARRPGARRADRRARSRERRRFPCP